MLEDRYCSSLNAIRQALRCYSVENICRMPVMTCNCSVVVVRIAPYVREPGFRNPKSFCSGIRNKAQEIRNPTNLSHALILEMWIT